MNDFEKKYNNIKLLNCYKKKPFYIFTDPLFDIRKQIENKEYKLRKMGYLYYPVICGLNLKMDRFRALLIETRGPTPRVVPQLQYNNNDDPIKFYIKEIYQTWVNL